ncbi:MAG: hypothetical protein HQK89_09520 [Nitrospirae bacterium]|nr:hypothetical protein [Nitrospirota bacterium]
MSDKIKKLMSSGKSRIEKGKKKKKEDAGTPDNTGVHEDAGIDDNAGRPLDTIDADGAADEGDSTAGDVSVGASVPTDQIAPTNEQESSNEPASSTEPTLSNELTSPNQPASSEEPAPTIQPVQTVQASPTVVQAALSVQDGLTGQFESTRDPSPSIAESPSPEKPILMEEPPSAKKPAYAAETIVEVPEPPMTQKDKEEFVVHDVSSQMRESLNIVLQSNLSAEILQTLASISAEDRQALLSLQRLGTGGISELCKIARDDEYVMTSKLKLISLLNLISKKEFVQKILQKAGAIVQAIARLRELLSL